VKIRAQLEQVHAALDTWARGERGRAEIASDPFHLFSLLLENPGGVRAIVQFQGETIRGMEEASLVDRTFLVVISRTRPLSVDASASLVKTTTGGGARPLFDLVEDARQIIRGLQFDAEAPADSGYGPTAQATTEITPLVRSVQPLSVPDGVLSDAYQIEFSIGTLLPTP
jgi:hypothetical protein